MFTLEDLRSNFARYASRPLVLIQTRVALDVDLDREAFYCNVYRCATSGGTFENGLHFWVNAVRTLQRDYQVARDPVRYLSSARHQPLNEERFLWEAEHCLGFHGYGVVIKWRGGYVSGVKMEGPGVVSTLAAQFEQEYAAVFWLRSVWAAEGPGH